jgi:hypothetical protein
MSSNMLSILARATDAQGQPSQHLWTNTQLWNFSLRKSSPSPAGSACEVTHRIEKAGHPYADLASAGLKQAAEARLISGSGHRAAAQRRGAR